MIIRQLDISDIVNALVLIKNVFNVYEAPDYSNEGIKTFYDFIQHEHILQNMSSSALKLWGAFEDDKIIGVIALRNINHIALFFVDADYHRKGIGRKLYETVIDDVHANNFGFITVNSSPYAVPVYHKLGFGYTNVEQLNNGLRYTPMKAFLQGKKLNEVTNEERAQLFPIILAPHNSKWKEIFYNEKLSIEKFPSAIDITGIHHYGSTAIPGIFAKPCVDILLEISHDADLDELIRSFQSSGYSYIHYTADLPPHIMFIKGYTDYGYIGQTYHIHVRYPGEHDELLFRNYLISHPDKAKEYETLKLNLKSKYEYDRDRYTDSKGDFIRYVVDLARKEEFI